MTAGIALAVKARVPHARLYTAEPDGFDDHARSFKSGRRENNAAHHRHDLRRADGADARASSPSRSTACWSARASPASDEEVAAAVAFAFRELKLVVEPGGAVALAALLAGKIDVQGKVAVASSSPAAMSIPELFYRLVA